VACLRGCKRADYMHGVVEQNDCYAYDGRLFMTANHLKQYFYTWGTIKC